MKKGKNVQNIYTQNLPKNMTAICSMSALQKIVKSPCAPTKVKKTFLEG